MKKTIEIDAPAYWASALINGDFSALDPEDADDVRQWLKTQGLKSPVAVASGPFTDRFNGLITEMMSYVFFVD